MISMDESLSKRIHLDESTGCWLWQGYKDRYGYGRLTIGKKHCTVPRLVYRLLVGPVDRKLCVCHHCDTPACINPAHLFLGTVGDNARDALRKGRLNLPFHGRGEAVAQSKLTGPKVRAIRKAYSTGDTTLHRLAAEYGVSPTAIRAAVRHLTWRHVV